MVNLQAKEVRRWDISLFQGSVV